VLAPRSLAALTRTSLGDTKRAALEKAGAAPAPAPTLAFAFALAFAPGKARKPMRPPKEQARKGEFAKPRPRTEISVPPRTGPGEEGGNRGGERGGEGKREGRRGGESGELESEEGRGE